MVKTKTYKDLIVWKKTYGLVLETYKFTKDFPKSEIYWDNSTDEKSSYFYSVDHSL
ncbi:MAG: four helix bundle protein [Candidatus Omnitrophica bacterium]|nr:four helix bundle protein [Candidatus Omnitrophota bacterium]